MSQRRVVTLAGLLGIVTLTQPAAAQPPGPDQPDRTIDAAERAKVVTALATALEARYVFPDVATRMATALRKGVESGGYGSVTSAKAFATRLTEDLAAIAKDKHLRVFYSATPRPPGGGGPPPSGSAGPAGVNFGFEKVERLGGNIGYVKLNGFMDPQSGAGDVAAAAMAFLAGTDALIVDLRSNGGGSPAMVAFLCSYFFGGRPVHLNDLYWRASNETQQWWTLPHVPGRRYLDREVYVLTSTRTFSAAEEFTYNLQTQKRATIVGETTGGGANPGGVEPLSDYFAAFVPGGRAINPITKTNWEGTGVTPDIAVAADLALTAAHRQALTKLGGKSRGPMLDRETKDVLDRLGAASQP